MSLVSSADAISASTLIKGKADAFVCRRLSLPGYPITAGDVRQLPSPAGIRAPDCGRVGRARRDSRGRFPKRGTRGSGVSLFSSRGVHFETGLRRFPDGKVEGKVHTFSFPRSVLRALLALWFTSCVLYFASSKGKKNLGMAVDGGLHHSAPVLEMKGEGGVMFGVSGEILMEFLEDKQAELGLEFMFALSPYLEE